MKRLLFLLLLPALSLPAFPAEDPGALAESEDVPYVFVTTTRDHSPALEALTPLKGMMDWQKLISDFIAEPWMSAYSTEGDFMELTKEEIQHYRPGAYTVITFDIESYEERIRIIRRPEVSESVDSIRFVVRWFYDDRLRRLYYEPVGLAPMAGVNDEEGNFLYSRPAFYWKVY